MAGYRKSWDFQIKKILTSDFCIVTVVSHGMPFLLSFKTRGFECFVTHHGVTRRIMSSSHFRNEK